MEQQLNLNLHFPTDPTVLDMQVVGVEEIVPPLRLFGLSDEELDELYND